MKVIKKNEYNRTKNLLNYSHIKGKFKFLLTDIFDNEIYTK